MKNQNIGNNDNNNDNHNTDNNHCNNNNRGDHSSEKLYQYDILSAESLFWSSSRCETNAQKINEPTKTKMCSPIYQSAVCWTPSMNGLFMLSCLVLFWKVTWLEEEQPWVPGSFPPRSREGGHARVILSRFFPPKLKDKRSTDMSTTSSEPWLKSSGSSQWSVNGTTTSPGPWKPLIAALTLLTFWALWHEML